MRNHRSFLLLTLISSFTFFSSTHGDENSPENCKKISKQSAGSRLNSRIKCNWYTQWGTVRESINKTNIEIFVVAQLLNFDEFENNLDFNGFIYVSWIEEDINWDYSFYDDMRAITVHPRYIWAPDIAVLSPGNEYDNNKGLGHTECLMQYDGRVACLNNIRMKISCQADFNLWPYDRQKCPLVITSWAYSSEQISLQMTERMPVLPMFRSNGEWNYSVSQILHQERQSNYYENVSSPQITIVFVADRMHTHLRGRYVAPAIIMMIMTLTTLWLDPKSIERLAIATLSIIVHIMCIQDIHWVLPHNGTTIPNILLFYVNSFVLATLALLLTFLLGNIKDRKSLTPKWMSSSIAVVLRSKVGQILLLGMLDPKATSGIEIIGDDDVMDSKPKETDWTYAVILFGWITFISFFFTYIIMYAVLIPSSAAKTPIEALNEIDRLNNQFGE